MGHYYLASRSDQMDRSRLAIQLHQKDHSVRLHRSSKVQRDHFRRVVHSNRTGHFHLADHSSQMDHFDH